MTLHHCFRLSQPHFLRSPAAAAAAVFCRSTAGMSVDGERDAAITQQKRALRSEIRKSLKALTPVQRAQEDAAIQNLVLNSSWFGSCTSLCAYISCGALREVDTSLILSPIMNSSDADHSQMKKKLYVPRVEDKNSRMRMLMISSADDLVANSMSILEPIPTFANGDQREDVMLADHPVDMFLLPGLAFDEHGCRLGRGGGYYDVFLKNYQELAEDHGWEQPLLVGLAYSVQVLDSGVIPVTPRDILVDALVCSSGVIPISAKAMKRM